MSRSGLVLLISALLAPTFAAAQDSSLCGAELRRADALVSAVAGRDRGGPYGPGAICGSFSSSVARSRCSGTFLS